MLLPARLSLTALSLARLKPYRTPLGTAFGLMHRLHLFYTAFTPVYLDKLPFTAPCTPPRIHTHPGYTPLPHAGVLRRYVPCVEKGAPAMDLGFGS